MNSWSEFECLHPDVVNALLEKQLTKPTHIQAEVFQHYHHYHDFLVAAQTGSGKTLAFGAPIISELIHLKQHLSMPRLPQCLIGLVLTPTRELAQQIEGSFIMALEKTNKNKAPIDQIKVACIIGGMSKEKQVRILQQKRPHIIIGTPGRLHDLLGEKILNFKNLKHLVIDEADRMIEMGHFKEIDEILEQIFEPKLKEVFDKDYEQANKMIDKKNRQAGEEFYVKENGKKIKLNLSINAIPTDQAFEVPSNMFTFADPHYQDKADKDQKGKKGKSAPKERETVDLPLTHD